MPAATLAALLIALAHRALAAGQPGAGPAAATAATGVAAAAVPPAEAGGLLEDVAAAMSPADGQAYLLEAREHLPEMEAALASIAAALPKNARGRLEAPAVRYALHRFFVRRYGWRLAGLDPLGEAWNSSSPSEVLALERMPAAVRLLLESRLRGHGLSAREVAVLAATLRHLVHGEAADRLRAAYRMVGVPLDRPAAEERAAGALSLHMASYIVGRDLATTPRKVMVSLYKKIGEIYPSWPETQRFVREALAAKLRGGSSGPGGTVGFAQVSSAMEDIGDKYGRWQDGECGSLKTALVAMEDHGTGRVRLNDFYGAGLSGKWQFQESVPYLRQLGALDESSPGNPRVIIPNYVGSFSNCIGSSRYHDICCISECEALLAHIEHQLGAPAAAPEDVAALVAALPSASVAANRTLSTVLLHRLQVIATSHGGLVPIYGRLFAQWMHHVYPRECPYPHLAGTTNPQTIFGWSKGMGTEPVARVEDMKDIASRKQRKGAPVQNAPWVNKEELLAPPSGPGANGVPVGWGALQIVAAFATLITVFLSLARKVSLAAQRLRPGAAPESFNPKVPEARENAPFTV